MTRRKTGRVPGRRAKRDRTDQLNQEDHYDRREKSRKQKTDEGAAAPGQITFTPWQADDGEWCCTIADPSIGAMAIHVEGKTSKGRLLALAIDIGKQHYAACLAMAALTSPIKDEREYGKKKVREWVKIGTALAALADEAIAEAKAKGQA